jgi:hypothetical protein
VIGALLAGMLLLAQADLLPAPDVLARYEAAVAAVAEPKIISFDFVLDQAGLRNGEQLHRVFRSGNDERDELLSLDGRELSPPQVRIFHNRPDRYEVERIAPRVAAYTFVFIGTRQDGRHIDYVFDATPLTQDQPFWVTQVAIDGVMFLPTGIAYRTRDNDGSGTISYIHLDRWWLPSLATARATYGGLGASERLSFEHYRFPDALPPQAFLGR